MYTERFVPRWGLGLGASDFTVVLSIALPSYIIRLPQMEQYSVIPAIAEVENGFRRKNFGGGKRILRGVSSSTSKQPFPAREKAGFLLITLAVCLPSVPLLEALPSTSQGNGCITSQTAAGSAWKRGCLTHTTWVCNWLLRPDPDLALFQLAFVCDKATLLD
jgi:hypothetical protein